MKIHSTKSFLFVHPTEPEKNVRVQNEEIKIVPDWVKDTLLFKLASTPDKNDHVDIFVIETKEQQIEAENGELSLEEVNKEAKKVGKNKDMASIETPAETK